MTEAELILLQMTEPVWEGHVWIEDPDSDSCRLQIWSFGRLHANDDETPSGSRLILQDSDSGECAEVIVLEEIFPSFFKVTRPEVVPMSTYVRVYRWRKL